MAVRGRRRYLGGYVVCTTCGRVLREAELTDIARRTGKKQCPYCGGDTFTDDFDHVIYVGDPEKSAIAKKLGIYQRGHFATSWRA